MRQDDHFILMADIIASRSKDQRILMADFKSVTKSVSREHGNWFLSPITITLGDEFQCVARGLPESIRILFAIEDRIIKEGKGFKLKYVLVEGGIETPLNRKIAYEMMGPGLTRARESLQALKKSNASRFDFQLKNAKLARGLNLAFFVYQTFVDAWKIEKDYYIVAQFLGSDDYKEVAEKLGKNKSLIWKREINLNIKPYKAIKNLITDIADG